MALFNCSEARTYAACLRFWCRLIANNFDCGTVERSVGIRMVSLVGVRSLGGSIPSSNSIFTNVVPFHLRCSRETEPSLCDWKSSQYRTLEEHHKEKRKTKQWQIDSETDHQYPQNIGKPWTSQWYGCPKNSFRAPTPPKDDGADANENQTHRGE